MTGRISGDDSADYFWFTPSEQHADELVALRVESDPPVTPAREMEPSESIDYANGVPENFRIKGRFTGSQDKDFTA